MVVFVGRAGARYFSLSDIPQSMCGAWSSLWGRSPRSGSSHAPNFIRCLDYYGAAISGTSVPVIHGEFSLHVESPRAILAAEGGCEESCQKGSRP